MGGRSGALPARGHAGGCLQDRRAGQPREHRRHRGDPLRLSRRAAGARPGARLRPRRRVRDGRNDRRDPRAPAAAHDDPHAEQPRGAAARRRRGRRHAACHVRRAPDRDGRGVRAHHGHARADDGRRQHALREGRRRAHRHVGAAAGQLPRLRLHARVRDRRDARQRARHARGGARGAGLHVARAQERPIVRAWASFFRIGCSGRGRTTRRPGTTPTPSVSPMPRAGTDDARARRRERGAARRRTLRRHARARGHRRSRRARRGARSTAAPAPSSTGTSPPPPR